MPGSFGVKKARPLPVHSSVAGKVLADEKGVDRRHPVVEIFDRSFQIFGAIVVQDHGPLAGDGAAVGGFDMAGCRGGQKRSEDLTPVGLHRAYRLLHTGWSVQGVRRSWGRRFRVPALSPANRSRDN